MADKTGRGRREHLTRRTFLQRLTIKHRILIAFFSLIIIAACAAQFRFHPDRNAAMKVYCSGGIHGHLSCEAGKSLGYAGISSAAKAKGGSLLLDMGDALCCSMIAETQEGSSVIRIMNAAGYGAMVPGMQDFAYGISALRKLRSEAAFPFLAANIRDANGKCLFEEYRILTVNHVKIGIVGVTDGLDEKTADRENLQIEDPSDTVSRVIASMGSQADAVIVMAYLSDSEELAQIGKTGKVSMVFSPAAEEGKVKEEDNILSACPGQGGSSIVEAELDVRRDTVSVNGRLLKVPDKEPEEKKDSPVAQAVEEVYSIYEAEGSQPLGYVDMKEAPEGKSAQDDEQQMQEQTQTETEEISETEEQTEEYSYHINETAIGDLTADAMLWQGSAEGARAALIRDREIRGSLFTGTVTRSDVYSLFEDDTYLVTCSMTGGQLRSILEDAFKGYPKARGFLQMSGITCTFTSSTDIGSALSDIQIDAGKLEDAASYTIVMTDSLAREYGYLSRESGMNQVMRSLGWTVSRFITQNGQEKKKEKKEPETDEDGDIIYQPETEESKEAPRIKIR